jgi:hypothetical protein
MQRKTKKFHIFLYKFFGFKKKIKDEIFIYNINFNFIEL